MPVIPLFPLNIVLFPGMQLPLNIYEDRYLQMIGECIDNDQPFGIVLIYEGQDFGESAIPYSVGCTAHITKAEYLSDGRILIMTVGEKRFAINQTFHDKPYLYADVDFIEDQPILGNTEVGLALRQHVITYLETLREAADVEFDSEQIPASLPSIAYLSCMLLQIDNTEKQELLEIEDLTELAEKLTEIYRREITFLQTRLAPPEISVGDTPFSLN
ncbi:MAG: LON peptidase substrate-binding domain-containing protein [Anaerolineae bacterium]|nr:LON peptidase substrate-binding domain-containing protein [Anaerolineae bacterium]MCA9892140.1 LON peptidase substrate-binding domain-containing protein [Anaerolineae bacterium]MCB9459997.1 LON peptidase substrate-binding domain-containing protein [Anaerolineaceae bacterium]